MKTSKELRSYIHYNNRYLPGFSHRSRTSQMGYHTSEYLGKPVVAIINTWSGINQCHRHFKERVEAVKRGVWQAGGFPLELPAISLSEPFQMPSTMMYRNMLAMETEELLRSYPVDGCVLMGGCDKTVPGLLMGAISVNLPTIFLPAGPMLRGNFRGTDIGSGTDGRKFWLEKIAGTITDQEWQDIESGIARSPGTCMTMGTASTMAACVETMGMMLSGFSSIPAVDSRHDQMSALTGKKIVDMIWNDIKPSDILTRQSYLNAVTTVMALSGSTNAVIHLIALAARSKVQLSMDDFDSVSRTVPILANLKPAGQYLMEDFYYAGGLKALLKELGNLLDTTQKTVDGKTLGELIADAKIYNADVIKTLDTPIHQSDAIAVLKGNLAINGALIKPTAMSKDLLIHTGKAVVFENIEDLKARINSPELDVDASSVLVLKNAGPLGGPGMPEWGNLHIPDRLLKQGVRDMVRISDARMSGTSFGACVLHVSPESFIGGTLALVKDGDLIELNVPERRLNLLVSDDELAQRRSVWKQPDTKFKRGYRSLYSIHVEQAHLGCDFDFLK